MAGYTKMTQQSRAQVKVICDGEYKMAMVWSSQYATVNTQMAKWYHLTTFKTYKSPALVASISSVIAMHRQVTWNYITVTALTTRSSKHTPKTTSGIKICQNKLINQAVTISIQLWHQRLIHPGEKCMSCIHHHVDGIDEQLQGNTFYCCVSIFACADRESKRT